MMSIDGDCVTLGAKKMHFNVNFNNETFQLHDEITEMIDKVSNIMPACETEKWPVMPSLLGNDYVKRIPSIVHAIIFNKTLPKLVT